MWWLFSFETIWASTLKWEFLVAFFLRVDYSLEYENLEKLYLETFLISKIPATFISKKNNGNLEFNLEKVNLEKVVGNLI